MKKASRVAIGVLLALTFAVSAHETPRVNAQETATGTVDSRTTIQYPKPVPMGSSCGNWQSSPFIYTGTCGLRVRFFFAPQVLAILSNNHVLGTQGPTLCPNTAVPFQTLTLQPGTLDIGSIPADPSPYAVGLVGGFIPINFSPGALNLVDAAVSFTTAGLADATILALGTPTQAITTPVPGMVVAKTGRTTNTTTGTIQAVGATVMVNYGSDCGTARFVGQIVITPGSFSMGGDSGSAILEQSSNIPVGLLFAGGQFSIANDIRLVYLLLGIFPDGNPPGGNRPFPSRETLLRETQMSQNPEIARVNEIRARIESVFFRNPDVVGVGVGLDESGFGLALIVYCKGEEGPVARALPTSVEGVPVRVVHSGVFQAYKR